MNNRILTLDRDVLYIFPKSGAFVRVISDGFLYGGYWMMEVQNVRTGKKLLVSPESLEPQKISAKLYD